MRLLRKPVRTVLLLLLVLTVVVNWTWGKLPDEPASSLTKSVAGKFDQVAYFEPGGPAAHDKQPVLMIHGLPGTHRDWEDVWPHLRSVRPIVVDRPGFGASGGKSGTLREQAEAMHDLLARMHATPAVVVGHSYGGSVALALASLYPQDVKAIVLVGSAAAGTYQKSSELVQAWFARVVNAPVISVGTRAVFGQAALRAAGRSGVEDAFDPHPVDEDYWQRFLESTTRPEDMRAYASQKLSFNGDLDWLDKVFPKIQKPAVVIHGAGDKLVPPKFGRRQAKALGAKLVLLPTGHMAPYSHPRRVASEIERLSKGRKR